MKQRSGWYNGLLSRVPNSEPPPLQDNIVQLPRPNLDDRAARIRDLDAALMNVAIEIDRLGLKFNTIRADLMRERAAMLNELKESGIKGEFVHVPPEAEFLETGP